MFYYFSVRLFFVYSVVPTSVTTRKVFFRHPREYHKKINAYISIYGSFIRKFWYINIPPVDEVNPIGVTSSTGGFRIQQKD